MGAPFANVPLASTSAEPNLPPYLPEVWLRATAIDSVGLSSTSNVIGPFMVGNDAPRAEFGTIADPAADEVLLPFFVVDSSSDIVNVEVEFRRAGDSSWRTAAISQGRLSGLTTTPGATAADGSEYFLVWDSLAPLDAVPTSPQGIGISNETNLELRIRALDTVDPAITVWGPWSTKILGQVRNQNPPTFESIEVPETLLHTSGGSGGHSLCCCRSRGRPGGCVFLSTPWTVATATEHALSLGHPNMKGDTT